MRKLIIAALFVFAVVCFAGANLAIADDCCKPACKQNTCTKECKPKCDPCKPKCDPCKPKCEPKCDPCKPKCEPKCDPCKPKCDPCKPKCKQNTCTKECKPKCEPCKPKCDPCKPKCEPCCKPKCKPCGPGGKWIGDYNACCPPEMPVQEVCIDNCVDPCDPCAPRYKHPYEQCWNGHGMLCDTGCCGTFLPCKRKCVECETVCKKVETKDECGCVCVEYVYETTCHEITRPTVIPWWFNENGDGNIYVDEEK